MKTALESSFYEKSPFCFFELTLMTYTVSSNVKWGCLFLFFNDVSSSNSGIRRVMSLTQHYGPAYNNCRLDRQMVEDRLLDVIGRFKGLWNLPKG